MDNNRWVKLYCKLADNEVLFDDKGLRVFIWLLTNVNKSTGKLRIGRFTASRALRLNPNTLYSVLKRLEKKYKIITASSNNEFTEISLLKWADYQATSKSSTGSVNTSFNNGSTPYKNKEYIDKKHISPYKEKIYKEFEQAGLPVPQTSSIEEYLSSLTEDQRWKFAEKFGGRSL